MDNPTDPNQMTQQEAQDAAMRAQGVNPEEKIQADYFGVTADTKYMLPDGVSYVMLRTMNEGGRSQYQKESSKDVTVHKLSGDAKLRVDQAAERHALLRACITDWNLMRGGQPVRFSSAEMTGFLRDAPTKVIDGIEEKCRELNEWLIADMKLEDIDAEIDRLREMRKQVEEEQAGNAA